LPRRVAVFRALQLGDLLCAVPALRALRAALPWAQIVLIGLPWAEAFANRFSQYLDGFREFPGWPGLPERPCELQRIPGFLAAVREERYDLVLQMHGSGGLTNPLTALYGGRVHAGFYNPGDYCPDDTRFLPFPARVPEVWRHLRLLDFLGVPHQGEELEIPLSPEDRRRCRLGGRGLALCPLIQRRSALLGAGGTRAALGRTSDVVRAWWQGRRRPDEQLRAARHRRSGPGGHASRVCHSAPDCGSPST
jgi:ADP-heptose:LPS heptosyltransferase